MRSNDCSKCDWNVILRLTKSQLMRTRKLRGTITSCLRHHNYDYSGSGFIQKMSGLLQLFSLTSRFSKTILKDDSQRVVRCSAPLHLHFLPDEIHYTVFTPSWPYPTIIYPPWPYPSIVYPSQGGAEQRNKWWPLEVPPLKKECTAAKRLPRARPLWEGQRPSSLSSSMLCSSSLTTFQYLPGQSRGCHTEERLGYSMRTHSWKRSSRCSSIKQRSGLSIDSCIYGDSIGE